MKMAVRIFVLTLLLFSISMATALDAAGTVLGSFPMLQKSGKIISTSNIRLSCKKILNADANAPSGEYYIKAGGRLFLVYCEMGLNGGGYTFLHPTSIVSLQDEDIQRIFKDKSTFLMRTLRSNGRQTYATLQQHTLYGPNELKIGLNQHVDYQTPINQGPYLYFGFIPRSLAAQHTTQGLNINGQDLQFTNCDANGNSHIVLFPNFAEQTTSGTTYPYQFGESLFTSSIPNPSGRMMPIDYFMFAEAHFGGCGCFSTTDSVHESVLATTIGFR